MYGYCDRWKSFYREINAGMYSPASYMTISIFLATFVSLIATLSMVIPMALCIALPGSAYFGVWLITSACLMFFDATNEMASFSGRDRGTLLVTFFGVHCTFTTGSFMPYKTIIWPFRIFIYILPSRFTVTALQTLTFGGEDSHFDGAYRLSAAPPEILKLAKRAW